MGKSWPGSLLRVLGGLLLMWLIGGTLVPGAALMQSSMEVTHREPAEAHRELDTIVARFSGRLPYVDLERRDGVLTAVVHH